MNPAAVQSWPAEVRRDIKPDGVAYEFSRRPLGKARWGGLALAAFGLVFAGIPLGGSGLLRSFSGHPGLFDLVHLLFLVPFVGAGLFIILMGLHIVWGRSRVEWRGGRLSVIELLGPLHWRRRFKGSLRQFQVGTADTSKTHRPPPPVAAPWTNYGALTAVMDDGKPRLVLFGYPKSWLLAMSNDISALMGGNPLSAGREKIEVLETGPEHRPHVADVPMQPAGSNVRTESIDGGIALIIPPAGLWRGSKGMLLFGIVWCAFISVFTVTLLGAALKGNVEGPGWMPVLFLIPFWAVGLGMLGGAVNMGRRRAMIQIQHGSLRIAQIGPFGKKQWQWNPGDIAAVRTDHSGMEVNNRPVIELQIHPRAGKKTGLFAGRDEEELRWMATQIRACLKVPAYA